MNWTNLIAELLAAGKTQKQVASYAGCSQSVISDIYTGAIKRPRYEIGKSLIELHKDVMKKYKRKGAN